MNSLSVTGKNWIFNKFNNEDLEYIKLNFNLDEIIAKLLAIKKINKKDIKNYLNPSIKNIIPNPDTMIDMSKATKRTLKAIMSNQKIGIFGDYDVDGASSTAMLGRYFSELKQNFNIYIPDRKLEGYGPNIKGFDELIKKGSELIFTVDCGTLSFEPIEYAYNKKIDVLVLDHHQSEVRLPLAHSIVNPNRLDDKSKLNYLCAAGVCFMFLISLNRELRKNNWFKDHDVVEPNLIDYLDLVSLGTVCDVVPLVELNRAIVKQGLKVLKAKKNIGLKTLFDICKVETHPTPYHLGYVIGPRINAGGRVGKCSHGANLLLNENSRKAFQLASELNDFNKERQILESHLLKEVLQNTKNTKDPVIILFGKNWHEGIIGIIASRIKDKFNKPTIIITENNGIGKASARSIVGFDMGSMIISAAQKGLIIKGGGHKMAGGFSIKLNNIENFKEYAIKKYLSTKTLIEEEKKIMIDSTISPTAVNLDFFNKVNNLAPFGSSNSEPKFIIENVKMINSKIIGEKHIKSILIGQDGTLINSIAFNAKESPIESYLMNKSNKMFNIAGKLSLNEWKGQKKVEFIIDDISVTKKLKNMVPSSIG